MFWAEGHPLFWTEGWLNLVRGDIDFGVGAAEVLVDVLCAFVADIAREALPSFIPSQNNVPSCIFMCAPL